MESLINIIYYILINMHLEIYNVKKNRLLKVND